MGVKVKKGTVVMRAWKQESGLDESRIEFSSLDQLFSLCLQAGDPPLVDRVVLEGLDHDGNDRTLVLTFQSITRRNE